MASLTERLYARTTQGRKEDEEERKVQVGIVTNKGSNVKETEKPSESDKKDTSKNDNKTESKGSLTDRLYARTTEGRAGRNPAAPGIVSSNQNSIRRRFSDIYGDLSAAEERVTGYKGEIDSWASRYGATSDNIMDTLATKYGAQKDESGTYIFSEQSSLDEFNRLMDELSGMYDKYNTGLTSYNNLFNQANTYDYESARTELDALEKRLKAAKSDVDNAQSAFRTGTELGAAGAEYDFLKKDYEDKQAAYNELFDQVVALNQDIKNAEFFQNSVYYNDYLSKDGIENYTGEVKHDQSEYMTDDEMRIYNYLYQQEGAQAANEYMDYLAETLNYREGTKRGEDIRGIESDIGRFLATGGYSLWSGIEGFGHSVEGLFKDEVQPTSATQYASDYIYNDLGNVGQKVSWATPDSEENSDGITLAQMAYGAGNTIGYMLPGIVASAATKGLINPFVANAATAASIGAGVGSTVLGLGSAGGAYQEKLAEGYPEAQARSYGAAVGASEAALSYVLGGISKLSGTGNLTNKALAKVKGIKSGAARALAAGGIKISGELVEEELQLWLEPMFATLILNEEYDAPTAEEITYTAILTALTTGFLEAPAIASYASNKPAAYGKQIKEAGGESIQALIESGLESAPDSESYALAEELNKQVQEGKTPSDWAVGRLQMDNAAAIRAEQAAEPAVEPQDTLESAAREVAASENENAPEASQTAKTEIESVPHNVMSADGRTSAAIKSVQEKTGYGEYGAKAVVSIAESTGENIETVQKAFDSAYKVGLSGMPVSRVTLETSVQQAAYDAGRRDAIMAGDIENAAQTEYNGNQRTEGLTNEEVHLRNGSQWNGSANPGGQIPGVAESARGNQSRIAQGKPADVGAASLSYGEKVSASSLGIRGGSTKATVQLVVSGDTAATKAARQLAKERGLRLVLFAGDNLNIEQTVKNADGKIGKVNVSARAFVVGDRVFVRADHPRYTADQLMRHEAGHDMIKKGEIDPQAVRKRIDQTFGKEKTAQLADNYASAYEGSGLTAEEIWEEVICDSLGDMNIFSGTVNEKVSHEFIGETKKAASETKTESVRGPPVNEGKASREWQSYELTDEYMRTVKPADRHAFLRTLANNTVGIKKNKPRKLAFYINDSVYFFTATGYMNGHMDKTMPISAGQKAVLTAREEFLHEVDNAPKTFDSWASAVRSDRGRTEGNSSLAGDRKGSGRNDRLSAGESERNGARHSDETVGDFEQEEVAGSLTYDVAGHAYKVEEDGGRTAFSRELDAEYMSAVESGDMKTVRSMVEDAAKSAGFTDAIPEQTLAYKTRTGKAPKKTVKVYKVFTVTPDGKPTALFVSGTSTLPQDVWLDAQDTWHFTAKNGKEYVPSTQNPYTDGGKTGGSVEIPNEEVRQELIKRGFLPEGSKAKSITALAYRPGWHAGDMPFFPQGGMKREGSNYPNIHRYNQVVFECELDADYDYTEYARNQDKAKKKDGTVNDRAADLQEMPVGGYYRYATNPLTQGGDKGMWYISGSLKIGRALTQAECDSILEQNGFLPQEWEQGELDLASLGYTGQLHEAARKTLAPITYDDNGKIIPLSQRFNPEVDDIRFSMETPVEEKKDLIAMHNMTEKNLRGVLRLGGFPMPSLAIVKAEAGHTKYGPISVVFSKNTIDPKASSLNKVYGGDAYTPTDPGVYYPMDRDMERNFDRMVWESSQKFAGGEFKLSSPLGSLGYNGETRDDIDEIADRLARVEAVQAAYLAEQGKTLEPVMREKVSDVDPYGNDALQAFIDHIGQDALIDKFIGNTEGNGRVIHPVELSESEVQAVREVLKEKWRNTPRFGKPITEEQLEKRAQKVDEWRAAKFAMNAWNFYVGGGYGAEEVDYEATRNAMWDMIAQGGDRNAVESVVREWVKSHLDGLLGEPGVYNGKSAFTSSGKRRSFQQRHDPYTLENIVKAMKANQQERGGNTFGISAGALQATATPSYKSIAEIKADSGRLGAVDSEAYTAKVEAVNQQIDDIISKVRNDAGSESFGGYYRDVIGDILKEAAEGKKTVDAIVRKFKSVGYSISTQTAKDIQALYKAAAELPTEYFEAKPQRAVGFDEVLAVVVPDNLDATLVDDMAGKGINVLTFKAGDDTDRLAKVNSVENAKFSREPNVEGKEISDEQQSLLQDIQSGVRDTVREELERMGKEYGWIKAGENPARDIRVPRKTDKDHNVSQTIRTILEAGVTPDAAVPTIEQMIVQGDFSYERITDKEALAEAEKTIERKGFETAMAEWMSEANKGIVSKANTAMGWSLYNAAATKGDLKTAMSILNGMVQHQRSAAQALQATRILKKMSPDAQLYGIKRSVESLQDELKKKYGDRAPDLKIDEDLARKFLEAQTDEERAEAEAELYRDIGRQMPATFMDKWNAWRYLAMLGNPRTHVRNIVGNLGFAPVVAAKNMTAGAIESAVNFLTGGKLERTKGMVNRKLLVAAYNDYKNVAAEISAGGKYNDAAIMNQNIEDGRTIFKFKPLEKARKGNSAALEAEDIWFARPHYAFALAQYCKSHGVTAEQIQKGKALGNARAYAIKEAQKATYKDTNAFSDFISKLGRYHGDNKVAKAASVVVEGILPFRKTPANILVRGIEYSPVGLINGLKQAVWDVQKGNKTAAEAIDNIAAGLTGTGLLGLGFWLAAEGLIRGAGGGDDEEKKYEELQGHQTYALELPDGTSITLDWLAPEVLPMFIGVNLREMTKENNGESNLADVLTAISNVTEPLLEMSCLQSLNDLFDNIGYASSGGLSALPSALASAATSYLTQAFPTILGQIERSSQDVRMTTYTEKDSFLTSDLQYTLGKISAKVPGWDFNQIPYIDAWGRTESSGGKAENIANNFLNPAYTSQIETSAMEEELQRLYDVTGEKGVLPDRASKYFTVNKERKDLTGEEYVEYATEMGQLSYDILTELTGKSEYDKLPDAEKAAAVEMAYDYATAIAKSKVSDYEPTSWVASAIKAEEFSGMDEIEYILYKVALSMADQNNNGNNSYDSSEKAAVVASMPSLSDADIAAVWDSDAVYAAYDADIDMRTLVEYMGAGNSFGKSEAEKLIGAKEAGIHEKTYFQYNDTLKAVDQPNKNGELGGTATNAEKAAAVAQMSDLDDKGIAYLWGTEQAQEAYSYGVDMKKYAQFKGVVDSFSGKDKQQQIKSYLKGMKLSAKDYLYLYGTVYSSVKDDADYVYYFGK